MTDAQRFVHEQNVARFVERLQREPDASQRDTLRQLLSEEVERFRAQSGAAAEPRVRAAKKK